MAALQIISVSPRENAANVSRTVTVIVTCSVDVDSDSVAAAPPYFTNVSTTEIIPAYEIDVDGVYVSFTIEESLDADTLYTITIPPGWADVTDSPIPAPSPTVWGFTTEDSEDLDVPTIISPSNYELVLPGELAVVFSRIEGAESYTIQVSDSRAYDSYVSRTVLQAVSEELTTGVITDPSIVSGSFYIRIRAVAGDTTSSWSDNLIISYDIPAEAETGDVAPYGPVWAVPAASFYISTIRPTAGIYNSSASSVVVSLSKVLPASIEAYPIVTATNLADGVETYDAGSDEEWTVSEDRMTLTWTPTDGMEENTTYTIDFSMLVDADGLTLADEVEYYFTTSYSVMYAPPSRVKSKLGAAIGDMTDADLAYHIFLASLAVNEEDLGSTDIDTIIEPQTVTSTIVNKTVLMAAISVLQRRIAEITTSGSYTDRLGDYTIQAQYNTLSGLENLLASLNMELQMGVAGTYSVKSEDDVPVALDGPTITARTTF